MKQKTSRDVLDGALRTHIREDVDLLPQIATQFAKGATTMKTRKNFGLAAGLVLLMFVAILFSLPDVVQALGKLFGYIPGVGIVASGDFRALTAPASQTKDGVTVTIQKGTIDANRTILTMRMNGLTSTQFNRACGFNKPNNPRLHLPDGTTLELSTYTNTGPTLYDMRYYFPALPQNINEATIQIPCLLYDDALTDWEIPLHFGPATGMDALPVEEIDPATPGAQTDAQSSYKISLALDHVIPLADGYLLTGHLKWDDGRAFTSIIMSPEVKVFDAHGNEVAAEPVASDAPDMDIQIHQQVSWDFKISGKDHAWPLTLKFADIPVYRNSLTYPTFSFDPGPNPQMGQTWPLNIDMHSYNSSSYAIHINSATLAMDAVTGKPGVIFDVQTAPDVLYLEPEDVNVNLGYQRMTSDHVLPGHLSAGFVFFDGRITGKRTFTFSSMTIVVKGNWQITWQP